MPWTEGAGNRKRILLHGIDLNAPGTLVQIVEITPHAQVANHQHMSCTEVFHILAGEGNSKIDRKTIAPRVGDTLTREPGEVHSTDNPNDAPFTCVVFKTNVVDNDLFRDPADD